MIKEAIFALIIFFIAGTIFLLVPNYGRNHDEGYTSSELTQVEDGDTIEYLDGLGNLTYAIDKHYALVVRKKDAGSRITEEKFYDAKYRPAIQTDGYYGQKWTYKDGEVLITFLNKDNIPIKTTSGYTVIRRKLNEKDQSIDDFYYDKNMDAVRCSGGYYGLHLTYDENGLNDAALFLDADGNPMLLNTGVCGYRYIRNDNGEIAEIRFLDQNETEVNCNDGYSRQKITYYRDGSWKTAMYFDRNNNPVRLSKGQYGILVVGDVNLLLTRNGNIKICLENILYGAPFAVVILGVLLCFLFVFIPREPAAIILFIGYIAFIIYETLMFRETGNTRINLVPLSCYRSGDRTQIMGGIENIWLFVPFGAGLWRLGKKRSVLIVFLISLLFSLAIETTQYFTGLGIAEFDDVFNNMLGGVIGALMAGEMVLLKSKAKDTQRYR